MIARIREVTDDSEFGDIGPLLDDIKNVSEVLRATAIPVQTFCIPKTDTQLGEIELFGYDFSDPFRGHIAKGFIIGVRAKVGTPNKLPFNNPWPSMSKADARKDAIICLERWVRAIDEGILPMTIEQVKQGAASDIPTYERGAYLSYIAAIQENPSLTKKPLRKVYEWIQKNGIEVDGALYDLPDEEKTWLRYRRAGERRAKPSDH